MLTEAADPVDRSAQVSVGLWLSVSDLAADRGVSKQVISKNLKRWAEAGRPVSTRRRGKTLQINVAEYDLARGDLADQARQQAEKTKKGSDPEGPVYTVEQARKMGYEADLKSLELDERLGKLVKVDDLEQAAIACGESVVRMIDQLATRAEDLAAAVAKKGVPGARAFLKDMGRELRQRMADEFAKLPEKAMAPSIASAGDETA